MPDARLTWLGHSTVLVELDGLTLLTDPLLRAGLGPLRRHGAVPDPAALPVPDIVLISHAHPDHLSRWSLRRLPGEPLIVAPHGVARRLARTLPRERIREVRLGDVVEHGPWRIRPVRARHWRWPLSPRAVAIGFLVEGPIGLWFAGDTGEYRAMRDLTGRVDVALLPIGRWGPQPTPGHLTPLTAARVAATVGARVVLPIHWGTFYPAGLERVLGAALHEPGRAFEAAMADAAPGCEVLLLEPGESARISL